MLNLLSQSVKHGRASSPSFGSSLAKSRLHGRPLAKQLAKPHAMVGVNIISADSDTEAQRLATRAREPPEQSSYPHARVRVV
jgi:hypothetical protein